jgi:hypothetical protein
MSFIVDPQVFDAKGGLINWLTVSRRHQKAARPAEIARERGLEGIWSIQLRWGFDPALGYPIEPFVVWSKPAGQAKVPVGFVRTPFGVILNQPCEEAVLELSAPVGGFVIAYPSMPLVATPVAVVPVAAGATSVRVTGSAIRTLVIPAQFTVVDIRTPVDLADDPNWVPIEHVGLPSHRLTSVHTDLLAKQGILATGLLSPPDAALDRFRRGAPFYGWADTITSGVAVTPWQLADPKAMVEVFNDEMLPDFVDMADRAFGSAQRWLLYRRLMQVPTGSQSAEATFNPLQSVLYGGLSDPLAALILGLGTAYPWRPNDSPRLAFVSEAGVPDFMVTGTFLDDNGDKVPRACFVLGPQPLNPPPAPGGLTSTSPGLQSPTVLDGPYRAVVTTAWNHLPPVLDFAVGSQAFARWGLNPARPAQMLLEPRARDTALQPVGAAQNESTPHRRSLSDTTWEIDPTVTPNSLRYAVAHQDVFGLWSGWTHTGAAVAVPPLSRVTLTAARLDCPPPGSLPVPQGPVPAALQFDLAWDWTSRRPQTISVVGRRYAQAKANDPPGDMTPPVADTFTATGAGVLLTLEFDPDGRIITNPDGTIATVGAGLTATAEHLTIDGQQTSPLPLQDRATRRYRISLNGLVLDFAAVSRWGLALWARGQERVQPQRTSAWNTVTVRSAAALLGGDGWSRCLSGVHGLGGDAAGVLRDARTTGLRHPHPAARRAPEPFRHPTRPALLDADQQGRGDRHQHAGVPATRHQGDPLLPRHRSERGQRRVRVADNRRPAVRQAVRGVRRAGGRDAAAAVARGEPGRGRFRGACLVFRAPAGRVRRWGAGGPGRPLPHPRRRRRRAGGDDGTTTCHHHLERGRLHGSR